MFGYNIAHAHDMLPIFPLGLLTSHYMAHGGYMLFTAPGYVSHRVAIILLATHWFLLFGVWLMGSLCCPPSMCH